MKILRKQNLKLKIGDKIEVVRFAFFPKRLNETTSVWLEKYIIVYECELVRKLFSKRKSPKWVKKTMKLIE